MRQITSLCLRLQARDTGNTLEDNKVERESAKKEKERKSVKEERKKRRGEKEHKREWRAKLHKRKNGKKKKIAERTSATASS